MNRTVGPGCWTSPVSDCCKLTPMHEHRVAETCSSYWPAMVLAVILLATRVPATAHGMVHCWGCHCAGPMGHTGQGQGVRSGRYCRDYRGRPVETQATIECGLEPCAMQLPMLRASCTCTHCIPTPLKVSLGLLSDSTAAKTCMPKLLNICDLAMPQDLCHHPPPPLRRCMPAW